MTNRTLTRLDVRPGPDDVPVVARALAAAMNGTGPAIAPVAANAPEPLRDSLLAALHVDDPVAPGIAAVVTTSGSTGDPLGVELGAGALAAAGSAGLAALAGPGHWLVAVPVTSVGGLMTLVRARLAGTEPVAWQGLAGAEAFTPESFLADSTRLLDRAGPDPSYVSLVPTQVERLVRAGGDALETLARFTRVIVGAAELAPKTHRAALAAGVALVRSYGMTETCGGICYDGHLLPGTIAAIEDPDLHGVGRITLSGPVLANGYRSQPERTAARFGPSGLRTDDLGRLEGGLLTVLGRADDVVQVGGTSVSLNAVADVLRTMPGIRDAAAVARNDPEWGARVVAVVAADADPDLVRLQRLVSDRLGRLAAPVAVRRVGEIPLLPNGKPDRTALAARADE